MRQELGSSGMWEYEKGICGAYRDWREGEEWGSCYQTRTEAKGLISLVLGGDSR